ncbi:MULTISPECIES: flavin-containing monooxygenase [Paenibacillus]|uniref:NAD(P)/FAD-dependent oxidoreductase n=1 Tax=Paenibacillus xylanilyticus TaxID=248903 RepID=A0A7Y6BUR6_9BACL|nr:NAD(P)-binding domain-containing protein [Paenibacillus xylanilyticus]NUU75269.1 NAD(P)/FAD-dependent oxidoreductase [Paenibacillus xylanilyticus]
MEPIWDVIVIGGGQAGLASGYHLKKKRLSFLILEAGGAAVGAWPQYYDNLKLFSPAKYSSLPGLSIDSPGDRYPQRDEVIQYLKDYASHFGLPLVYNSHVDQVSKESGVFTVTTSSGEKYVARNLILATGSFSRPYTPSIPNHEQFEGEILHSATYRTPAPFHNQSVIVVGRGNSAVQIAMELSEVAETTLAVREPVALIPQRLLGQDIHFWFKLTGIDSFWKFGKSFANGSSVLDLDGYKQRLKAGNPKQKKMFTAFYDRGVIWSDGTQEEVQTVIFATGYRSNVSYIDALGGLDGQGEPEQKNGISKTIPGLYFVGLSGQRSFASATLRGVGPDAEYVVKHIQNNLEKQNNLK